ncbi:MAG: sigma 54-interacting transcriptional regulator [Oligoflexales bacterium]
MLDNSTGTGKELVAKAVHMLSGKRSKKPMISVNCAAFSQSILEAELFGVRKGAFTDAKEDRKGIFEVADQSTLFLDEISDLPLNLQSKLLRAIQEQEIYPVGSTKPIKIDIRIIAATNSDLKSEIKNGRFRQDLYYRLSVLTLYTRPLRERKDDIKELSNFFLNKFSQNFKIQHLRFTDAQHKALQGYSWPGNVRELRNVIERSVLMSDDNLILKMENEEDAVSEFAHPKQINKSLNYTDFKLKSEHAYLKMLMEASKENFAEAARISGLHRPSIYRMLKRVKDIKY